MHTCIPAAMQWVLPIHNAYRCEKSGAYEHPLSEIGTMAIKEILLRAIEH